MQIHAPLGNMVHLINGLILYVVLQLFKLLIVRSEFTTTVQIVPGDELFLNCSEFSSITVHNVSVLNIGNCETRQKDCNLNSNDQKLINECNGSPNCLLNGSLLTSACLWEDLHFDISYICKASYEYVGCYVDDTVRVLGEEHKRNNAMSADICFGICTENQTTYKHVYFGTQFEHECFCGDGEGLKSTQYPRKKDFECNMNCSGHEDEKCGGIYKMSVYKIKKHYANEKRLRETSENNTGMVAGSVVGSVIFLCIVFIGICIRRRFVFCAKSKEKLRNTPETKDYVGNQDIALPQAVSPGRHVQYEDLQTTLGNRSTHNYSSTNIHLQNIDDKYDYARTIETINSKTLIDRTSAPTYVVLHDDGYKPNPEANDDEYAVVDPTAESSFTKTTKTKIQGQENYMILDPSQTGIDRSKFANTNQAYELAKPIHDTNGHIDDLYVLSPEGTYDHSGITRHHKDQDTIYAVDNVYDSAIRGVNIVRKEDTYDHFFGKETEDENNIFMH